MKFIFRGTKYEMDDTKITFAEARAVEKVTGRTMGDIGRTGGDDITSLQAMIWIAMKRTDPTMRFTDLDDMPMGDLEMLPDDDEEDDQAPPDPPEAVDPLEDSPSSE